MTNVKHAQERREYKTIPNMFVARRPDGIKVAVTALHPDDPGFDGSKEDGCRLEQTRIANRDFVAALRQARRG